jgi:hypothetical protein
VIGGVNGDIRMKELGTLCEPDIYSYIEGLSHADTERWALSRCPAPLPPLLGDKFGHWRGKEMVGIPAMWGWSLCTRGGQGVLLNGVL